MTKNTKEEEREGSNDTRKKKMKKVRQKIRKMEYGK